MGHDASTDAGSREARGSGVPHVMTLLVTSVPRHLKAHSCGVLSMNQRATGLLGPRAGDGKAPQDCGRGLGAGSPVVGYSGGEGRPAVPFHTSLVTLGFCGRLVRIRPANDTG